MVYRYNCLIGEFSFNEHGKLMDKKGTEEPGEKLVSKILEHFSDKKYFQAFRDENIKLTREQISHSLTYDIPINQAINTIEEMTKVLNTLTKRLREWYAYYIPEIEDKIENNDKFLALVAKDTDQLKKEFNISNSMGGKTDQKELEKIKSFAQTIISLQKQRYEMEKYLDEMIHDIAPNMQAVIGTLITAKLIEHVGSLKRLTMMPSSTIQLLGAEKALFRHLKNKNAKCPKFGHIYNHEMINGAKKSDQGRIARMIASKLTIAIKVDYFKGKFIGDKLAQEIKEKI